MANCHDDRKITDDCELLWSPTGAHFLYRCEDSSRLELITASDIQANRYRRAGHPHARLDRESLAYALFRHPLLSRVMTVEAWDRAAVGLGSLYRRTKQRSNNRLARPLFKSTPLDLPAELAAQRLIILSCFSGIENIPAQIELTEVLIAHQANQAVRPSQFQKVSLKSPGWADQAHQRTPQNLQEELEFVASLMAKLSTITKLPCKRRLLMIARHTDLSMQRSLICQQTRPAS